MRPGKPHFPTEKGGHPTPLAASFPRASWEPAGSPPSDPGTRNVFWAPVGVAALKGPPSSAPGPGGRPLLGSTRLTQDSYPEGGKLSGGEGGGALVPV